MLGRKLSHRFHEIATEALELARGVQCSRSNLKEGLRVMAEVLSKAAGLKEPPTKRKPTR